MSKTTDYNLQLQEEQMPQHEQAHRLHALLNQQQADEYDRLAKQIKETEEKKAEIWRMFSRCNDEAEGTKLLDAYTTAVTEIVSLRISINQVYNSAW